MKKLNHILAVCCVTLSTAAFQINPDIEYYFGTGPGEALSVSADGKFIMVASPASVDGVTFNSTVPQLRHHPDDEDPFGLRRTLSLPGEVTEVALPAHGQFGLAVVRSDAAFSGNLLVAIRGNGVLQEISIPASPDGMKITPDGRYAILAVERGGSIHVYDLKGGAGQIELAAVITKAALAAYYVGVPNPAAGIEPEAVAVSKDSSFALVTIQDVASVAALDLTVLDGWESSPLSSEGMGSLMLRSVIHLPFGFVGNNGALFGVEPDGIVISPDASFAIVAHEANQRAKHLQGLSVLDLRGGLENIVANTYSIFDIDPTLLANTGLAAAPVVGPGDPYPTLANRLPRLDPASVELIQQGDSLIASLVIERYDPSTAQLGASLENETRGSVLFLEVSNVFDGTFSKLLRVPVGNSGSRLEAIETANEGKWIFVSISNGGGANPTFARIEAQ
jgi:DNA-binding beta-propeller fold protein YncE